ncbi:hypothetical protein [Aeromicrobium sp. UC242_57]|uniref:hypothetical protein n=1 Tax=Aeromicrobium sp. UC242_57 TaxID=3374624 RepID=UPI0037A76F52
MTTPRRLLTCRPSSSCSYLAARRAELDLSDANPSAALARLEPWLGEEAPTRIHDVMLLSTAAEACLALGDVDRGEHLVDRALRRAAATRNQIDGIDAQRVKARCHLLRGRRSEARECLDEALSRASALPYPSGRARIQLALDEV